MTPHCGWLALKPQLDWARGGTHGLVLRLHALPSPCPRTVLLRMASLTAAYDRVINRTSGNPHLP